MEHVQDFPDEAGIFEAKAPRTGTDVLRNNCMETGNLGHCGFLS